jgi:ribosomal protein S18 acetylase RimI-like enzyme
MTVVGLRLSRDELVHIERAAVRAWPALETINIDGWLWRYTGGGSQRANSVSTLIFCGRDTDAAITDSELRYRSRSAPTLFQICEINQPVDVDSRLAQRGYRVGETCTTLAKTVDSAAMLGNVEVSEYPTSTWLTVYLAGISADRRQIAPRILERVPRPRAFVLLRDGGQPTSTALGVACDGVIIAECISTLPDRRRAGHGKQVMQALEAWGVTQDATFIALQAVATNVLALGLYARLGYQRVSCYHYRVLEA